jgi:replicative DNA helicase
VKADRTLPYNLVAEESLLGAMLLSFDAVLTAYEIVIAADFYKPAHGHIFQAIIDLYLDNQPGDPVTVADALQRKGLLETVGGPGFLVNLQAGTPATSNAGRYATIVVEHAGMRRLMQIGNSIVEAGYDLRDPGEILEEAKVALSMVDTGEGARMEGLTTMEEFLARPEEDRGQWVIPGLVRERWRIEVVAGEGVGKAVALDTLIPTPSGWTTMGELEPGDLVFSGDGAPVRVLAKTEPLLGRPCFEVCFRDGERIVADENHLWQTVDYRGRQHGRWDQAVRTTRELAGSARARRGFVVNHLVEPAGALQLPDADLAVDPYVLGVWLGDGTSRSGQITSADAEVIGEIRRAGWQCDRTADPRGITWIVHREDEETDRLRRARELVAAGKSTRAAERSVGVGRGALRADDARGGIRIRRPSRGSLATILRSMGLLGDKRIPAEYLRASVVQREALLAGLLDADGSADRNSVELTLTNPGLASDAVELIRSLGFRPGARWSDATLNGRVVGRRCRIVFTPDRPVFRLHRKQVILRGACHYRSRARYVESVNPVPSVPVACIQVEADDGLFLVGRSMVRTHNSVLLRQLAIATSAGVHPFTFRPMTPQRALIVDLENPDDAIDEVCAPMVEAARLVPDYDPERLYLWRQEGGIDLRKRRDRVEFESVLRATRPKLVCLGPAYKAFRKRGHDDEEVGTGELLDVLGDLRKRYEFGLVFEHHAPHGDGKRREIRPHGSVLWQRWPEIGIALTEDDRDDQAWEVNRFRGDRVKNVWPVKIERIGGPWPWGAVWASGQFDPEHPDDVEPLFTEF